MKSSFRYPPSLEQTEFVRRVEILFAFADRLEARLATARQQVEQLTPALLAKAFRGELVPQDPGRRAGSRTAQAPGRQARRSPVGKRFRTGAPGTR